MLNNEINTNTCFIKKNDNKSCLISNGKEEIVINMSLKKYLNYNCEYYGSSFEGRKQSSKLLLGSKYKLPIIIEESREIVFFPTKSSKSDQCTWIALNNIKKYEENNYQVKVTFKTGYTKDFDISIESFENQILRASKLELILKKRKEQNI